MARSLGESCASEELMVSREAGDGAKASDFNVGVLPGSVAAGTVGPDLGLLSY